METLSSAPTSPLAAPAAGSAEQARWNRAYCDPIWRRTRFQELPNAFVVDTVRGLPPGRALDMHMGQGRNALHLAALGWQVTGVEVADQAVAEAQLLAQQRGLSLTTHVQDSHTFGWGQACWDLIVLCYTDEEDHAAQAALALRAGGLVVFENFHADINAMRGLAPDQRVGFVSGELPARYTAAGFEIMHYEEPLAVADFSLETQRLVRLVARRPALG